MHRLQTFSLLVASWLLAVSARAEPALLAHYEVRRAGAAPETLLLMRSDDRIEHRYPARATIELWRRVGPDELEHQALYPREGKGVRYTAGDLRALSELRDWPELGSLLSERERGALTPRGTTRFGGRTLPLLHGTLRGRPARVAWLDDARLPAELTLGRGKQRISLRLVALRPCTPARCDETAQATWRLFDFADLGDMTYDPFVQQFLRTRVPHAH